MENVTKRPPMPKWACDLQSALQKNTPAGTCLGQLATIRAEGQSNAGRPSCRTVNMRQLDEDTLSLYFVSDTRSGKAMDVSKGQSRFAELCLFCSDARMQVRLSGVLSVLMDCEISNRFWQALPPSERIWWAWPTPAERRAPDHLFQVEAPLAPPAHFCVCSLRPDFVDVLHLEQSPFKRFIYQLVEGNSNSNNGDDASSVTTCGWSMQSVNP